MIINKQIFRAYDIRGNAELDLTDDVLFEIGAGIAQRALFKEEAKLIKVNKKNQNKNKNSTKKLLYPKKEIICAVDGRLSSPRIYNALSKGLLSTGASVNFIGLVPTPILYFADILLNPAASIMITGSHNPKEDNGIKIIIGGEVFFDQEIQELYSEILNHDRGDSNINNFNICMHASSLKNRINVETLEPNVQNFNPNIVNQYIDKISNDIYIDSKIKIVWDPANGAVASVLNEILSQLPNQNIIINKAVDGNFPSHHPDPSKEENLTQLIHTVIEEKAHLGIAFDGDGDRLAVVTRSGDILKNDELLMIFVDSILRLDNPLIRGMGNKLNTNILRSSRKIIADVKTSNRLFEMIKMLGGVPLMCKTGHAFIKNKIKQTAAIFAGEMSGHIFFADRYYGYDDAIYASLRFIEIVSLIDNFDIEAKIRHLPKAYSTKELRISVSAEKKFAIMSEIKEYVASCIKNNVGGKGRLYDFCDIDGVRLSAKGLGWWLLRASNTESCLVARLEAFTLEGLDMLKNNFASTIEQFGLSIEFE